MISVIVLLCVVSVVGAQTNPGCMQGWTYFKKSNKCFKLYGGQHDPSFRPMTWHDGELLCTTFKNGHLASFHSDEEVTFVVGLSQQFLGDDKNGAPIHVGHSYIGNDKWKWSDGSPWTYTKWTRFDFIDPDSSDLQNQSPSGSLYTQRKWAGTLWMGSNDEKLPFVCQMPPSNQG